MIEQGMKQIRRLAVFDTLLGGGNRVVSEVPVIRLVSVILDMIVVICPGTTGADDSAGFLIYLLNASSNAGHREQEDCGRKNNQCARQ